MPLANNIPLVTERAVIFYIDLVHIILFVLRMEISAFQTFEIQQLMKKIDLGKITSFYFENSYLLQ